MVETNKWHILRLDDELNNFDSGWTLNKTIQSSVNRTLDEMATFIKNNHDNYNDVQKFFDKYSQLSTIYIKRLIALAYKRDNSIYDFVKKFIEKLQHYSTDMMQEFYSVLLDEMNVEGRDKVWTKEQIDQFIQIEIGNKFK